MVVPISRITNGGWGRLTLIRLSFKLNQAANCDSKRYCNCPITDLWCFTSTSDFIWPPYLERSLAGENTRTLRALDHATPSVFLHVTDQVCRCVKFRAAFLTFCRPWRLQLLLYLETNHHNLEIVNVFMVHNGKLKVLDTDRGPVCKIRKSNTQTLCGSHKIVEKYSMHKGCRKVKQVIKSILDIRTCFPSTEVNLLLWLPEVASLHSTNEFYSPR
jgi:hypothetical protein